MHASSSPIWSGKSLKSSEMAAPASRYNCFIARVEGPARKPRVTESPT